MKMVLFHEFNQKIAQADWSKNPELGLLDTILESHPELLQLVKPDIISGLKESNFGRKDMPSVEQILRAALFKEIRGLDYRELEYAQSDSRICGRFIKLDPLRHYSFQMYQTYISKIREESLQNLMVAINKIAIGEGLESIEQFRQDSFVIETNIHYPTNNSLVWDCIKESHRLLEQLSKEVNGLSYRDYMKGAKKTYFKINNTKAGDQRVNLFNKQLILFTKVINNVSNAIKKKDCCNSIIGLAIVGALESLMPLLEQVYDMTYRREIAGESVANDQKLFSIYELHTDIIVKGGRKVKFGHKVNVGTGKSNLILACSILKGNPADSTLYQDTVDKVVGAYGKVPRDSATDGGFASKANADYAKSIGIVNIVFNKIVGSLNNIVSSKNMETRLKKWRSGIEANISNLLRGFNLSRCTWKGFEHFKSKVLWSVIAYNIRVMAVVLLKQV
jgi:IS5 family transposase